MFIARANFSALAACAQTCVASIFAVQHICFFNKFKHAIKNSCPTSLMDIGLQGSYFKALQAVTVVDTNCNWRSHLAASFCWLDIAESLLAF